MTAKTDGGPVKVPLIGGGFALVSECDFPLVSMSRWRVGSNGYVYKVGARLKGVPCLLHRIVMSAKRGQEIHHENGDKLDCTRGNLSALTPSEHQEHHKHIVIERNLKSRVYPLSRLCKNCGIRFKTHRDHRGRQTCCSKDCALAIARSARSYKRANAMLAARENKS